MTGPDQARCELVDAGLVADQRDVATLVMFLEFGEHRLIPAAWNESLDVDQWRMRIEGAGDNFRRLPRTDERAGE